jgi:ABC-type antimicrobial peptide transport system permease subunit
MEPKDIVRLGTRQLGEKKFRTVLTVIMVVIGVASIVALTSQTAGADQNIKNQFEALGPDAILIMPSGSTHFTSADIANLEALPNVSTAIPVVSGQGTLSLDGYNLSVDVIGVSANGLQTILGSSSAALYNGTYYPDGFSPDAVVGHDIAFASSSDPNLQTAMVGDTGTLVASGGSAKTGSGASKSKIYIPVVGILQSHGSSLVSIDSSVIVSLPFAETILHQQSFNEILVEANSPQNVSSLASLIEVVYGSNARVIDTQQLANTFTSIASSTQGLYIIIAGISLLVAAIGIMNVMLMAVSERVHDIGILKSIGFESRDVMLIFLFQAMIIGVLGGMIGLAAGMVASYTISYAGSGSAGPGGLGSGPHFQVNTGAGRLPGAGQAGAQGTGSGVAIGAGVPGASSPSSQSSKVMPIFTPSVIADSIAVAIAISIIAGIYPAWKASKMEPIDALRTL